MANTAVVFNLVARDNLSKTLTKVSAQMDRMQRQVDKLDGRTATVHVRADTSRASRELSRLGSAFGKVGGLGASVAKAAVPGLTALASAGTAAAAGIAPAVGSLALLPAVAMAGAAAGGALALGLHGVGSAIKDMGDPKKFAEDIAKLAPSARATAVALQSLHPQFKALQQDVQQHLFAGMAAPLKSLAQDYVPLLRTQLTGMADTFNLLGQRAITFFHSASVMADMRTTLGNVNLAARNAAPAFGSILSIFKDIGTVGSQFLPQIGTGFANAARSANIFINNARQTGQLQQFIAGALHALAQLGSILVNLGSAIGAIFQAGASQGKTMLTMLVQLTGQVASFMHSFAGQQAIQAFLQMGVTMVHQLMLTFQALAPAIAPAVQIFALIKGTIFTLANTVIRALAPAFTMLLNAVLPIIQMLSGVFTTTMQALTPIIGQLATVFVSVLTPILRAFAGIIAQLMPVFVQIAGVLVSALVPVLRVLGQVVMALMPFIRQMATAIGQVLLIAVRALTPILRVAAQLMRILAPIIGQLATMIGGILVTAVRALTPIIGVVAQVMQMLAPVIGRVATMLGQILLGAVRAIAPIVGILARAFIQVIQAVLPLIPTLLRLVMAVITPLLGMLPMLTPLITLLAQLFVQVMRAVMPLLNILVALANFFLNLLIPVINFLMSSVKFVFGLIVAIISAAIIVVTAVIGGLVNFARAVGAFFTGPFVNFFRMFGSFFTAIWNAAVAVFITVWNWIKSTAITIWTVISTFFTTGFNAFLGFFRFIWNAVSGVFIGVWNWIKSTAVSIWNTISGFFTGAFHAFTGFFSDTWNGIVKKFSDIWGSVVGVAKSIWDKVSGAFKDGVNAVTGFINKHFIDPIDTILSKIGLGDHVIPLIPQWKAAGGPIVGPGGPTADRVPVMASNGEFMMRTAAVQKYGLGFMHAVNSGKYAQGGLIGGVQHLSFGGAILDFGKNLWHGIEYGVKTVTDLFTKGPVKTLDEDIKPIVDAVQAMMPDNLIGDFGKGSINKMYEWVRNKVKEFFDSTQSGGNGGPGVQRWAPLVVQALAMLHQPASLLPAVLRRMNQESGGNPRAINLWDSNARAGHPSMGLMQTIPGTFAAYAGPFVGRGIWDPMANIYAGLNYAIHNYPSLAAAMNKAGGYALGTPWVPQDQWAFLHRGEAVVPADVNARRLGGDGAASPITINVYPQPGQSEEEIGAVVERRLSFALRGKL